MAKRDCLDKKSGGLTSTGMRPVPGLDPREKPVLVHTVGPAVEDEEPESQLAVELKAFQAKKGASADSDEGGVTS
jgi:hypothetical protein